MCLAVPKSASPGRRMMVAPSFVSFHSPAQAKGAGADVPLSCMLPFFGTPPLPWQLLSQPRFCNVIFLLIRSPTLPQIGFFYFSSLVAVRCCCSFCVAPTAETVPDGHGSAERPIRGGCAQARLRADGNARQPQRRPQSHPQGRAAGVAMMILPFFANGSGERERKRGEEKGFRILLRDRRIPTMC